MKAGYTIKHRLWGIRGGKLLYVKNYPAANEVYIFEREYEPLKDKYSVGIWKLKNKKQ